MSDSRQTADGSVRAVHAAAPRHTGAHPDETRPHPTVYFAGTQSCPPGHFWSGIRDHCLLHVVEYGSGTFTVADTSVELGPGDAFLIQSGDLVRYCASEDNPWRYHWVGFVAGEALYADTPLPRRSEAFSIHPFVKQFIREHEQLKSDLTRSEVRPFAAIGSLYRLLQVVYDAAVATRSAISSSDALTAGTGHGSVNRYVRALYWIVHKTYSHPITVEEIAGRIGISRKHLSEVVRRETGTTPMQILTEHRLHTGRQLLLSTDLSIADIARSCGYKDQLLFARRFRAASGCSPTEFRRCRGSL